MTEGFNQVVWKHESWLINKISHQVTPLIDEIQIDLNLYVVIYSPIQALLVSVSCVVIAFSNSIHQSCSNNI